MRVLIVHNEYGKYSGEEAVVDRMIRMLRNNGHEVQKYTRSSAEIPQMILGQLRAFLSALYNPHSIRKLSQVVDSFKPDVVNIHNLYPLISPAVLFSLKRRGIPVVMTIHNFRLMCPTGLFMRNGLPCEKCLLGSEWNAVKYNCENNLAKSAGYALRNWVARVMGSYRKCVTRFACITDFQRQKLIAAGFDPSRIEVIPNFMETIDNNTFSAGNYIGFSGRLSFEKGVDLILEVARRHPEIRFKLAGEIRQENGTEDSIATLASALSNVELMGYLSGHKLENFYRNASSLVMASRWYEGFPMSILDAASYAKPMVAPDIAGFPEIIDFDAAFSPFQEKHIGSIYPDIESVGKNTGLLFAPGDVDDLEQKIVWLWNHPELNKQMGENALRKLKHQYSAEAAGVKWEALLRQITGANIYKKPHAQVITQKAI